MRGSSISLLKIYVYKYCSFVYIILSLLPIRNKTKRKISCAISCILFKGESARPSSDQVPTKFSTPEQESLRELIAALGSDTLSATQLMERMGLVHRPHFRQFYLVPALEKGIIERTIPDKPNSPRQRYRVKKQDD